jgi:glycosyltransferase involved in cell wall biosynthesis
MAPEQTLAPPAPAAEESLAAKGANAAVSIVVPAYNEEAAIGGQIERIRLAMQASAWPFELIVVDDGSTDGTAAAAARHDVRLLRLGRNRGYGAALKAGIAAAQNELIVICDADGTYPAESIPALLEPAAEHDMVVGARTGANVHVPLIRQPAKWLLTRLASYLAAQPIPDLNSGLRVLRRATVARFEHLLPSGFSFTTTITLALLCNDGRVAWVPIDYRRRVGASKIRPVHVYEFLLLILRTMVYFNPLRVFLPAGGVLFALGLGRLAYDVTQWNVTDSAVMGILGGVILWAVGLLADQMSRIAMSLKAK